MKRDTNIHKTTPSKNKTNRYSGVSIRAMAHEFRRQFGGLSIFHLGQYIPQNMN